MEFGMLFAVSEGDGEAIVLAPPEAEPQLKESSILRVMTRTETKIMFLFFIKYLLKIAGRFSAIVLEKILYPVLPARHRGLPLFIRTISLI